ncbi:glycoside hydrolase family 28 protein [Paxillus rubicundulus Ve08.2h10]|uniref:galacturonan 1,4-alpha-galacturonidase n=1 Tax=Paxillus rubicundulus Ve08.2h10 TaxID=930991 RepID=A0A0D0DXA2_9AGAM|nr:glycoside hydrolase family 28 protein [Paxillus rubicundulus Ve08.2h10]
MRFSTLLGLLPAVIAASPSLSPQVKVAKNTCTVVSLGGGQDDGPNILYAFETCRSGGTIVLDQSYVVNTVLVTSGLKNVRIELSGVVQYTPNIPYWSLNSYFLEYQNATTYWFLSGDHIHLYGGGTLHANGQVWWDYPHKVLASPSLITYVSPGTTRQTVGTAGGSSTAFARPIPLTVGNASNVLVEDLTQIGSPLWASSQNNFVYQSTNVTYRRMNISSTSYSSNPAANSDGWDIYRSSYITIEDSTVHNHDDCVSFKPNTTNAVVRNLYCNGSHGISVGSLGQYAGETDIVANIYVKNISMNNAQNGARIKVFGGSPDPDSTAGGGTGYVRNVTFENFYANNVDYPIYINQCYSTPAQVCAKYPSKLVISDVHYINVHGTSSGNKGHLVAELECTSECHDITATGTNLTSPKGPARYYCQNIASETLLDFPCTSPPP